MLYNPSEREGKTLNQEGRVFPKRQAVDVYLDGYGKEREERGRRVRTRVPLCVRGWEEDVWPVQGRVRPMANVCICAQL